MSRTSPRIERAAALLDATVPEWEASINLDRLDMSSSCNCILGQLYDDYNEGIMELDGKAERAPAWFGFLTWGEESYWSLTRKWREFLEGRAARREAA